MKITHINIKNHKSLPTFRDSLPDPMLFNRYRQSQTQTSTNTRYIISQKSDVQVTRCRSLKFRDKTQLAASMVIN